MNGALPPLRPLQAEAVELVASGRRYPFLADCVGGGKTRVALEVLDRWGSRRVVVATSASMIYTVAGEVAKWMGWPVAVAEGRAPPFDIGVRVVVVSHAMVGPRLAELVAWRPDALVYDEAHRIRNDSAGMSEAALRLASKVPAGRRIALTATPFVNRNADLVNQLDLVGALWPKFGGPHQFRNAYCWGGMKRVAGGRTVPDYGSSINTEALRRQLDDVWVCRPASVLLPELPPVQRVPIHVPLSNRDEYERIERDLAAWMVERRMLAADRWADPVEVREKVAGIVSGPAGALVQLSAYRHACGRGKARAAVEWIRDFLDGGEPLAAFALHRDVQDAILRAFPDAVSVRGGDGASSKQRAVEAFQRGDSDLFVGAIDAAGEGITLTRASNCLVVELPWTAVAAVQLEGRMARIGQKAASLTSHYLLGIDSVDDAILRVIESKQAGMEAVGTL